MTALAGILSFSAEIDAKQLCERMLRAQASYSNRPPRIIDGPAGAIGGALFATLPEDSRGPCVHKLDPGTCVLAADIRLDDRVGWVERLNLSEQIGASLSDSGLLARDWQVSAAACIPEIYGDFALAALDHVHRELVLARDFLGQRPLFYHAAEQFVAFASMPIGLLAIAPSRGAPDTDALARYLAHDPQVGPSSFLEGISAVRPGELVRFAQGGPRAEQYWNPPRKLASDISREDAEAAALRHFDRAVAVRLRRMGEVGCHLSGGLDSSAVMASAALQLAHGCSMTAFTAVPPVDLKIRDPAGRFIDEGDRAAAAAGRYGNVEHVRLAANPANPADLWDKAYALFQSPLPNPCNFPWNVQICEAAKARGIGVLLTGTLGNLSIGFDPGGFHAQLFAQGSFSRLWQETRGSRKRGRRWRSLASDVALPFLPKWLLRKILGLFGRDLNLERASFVSDGARLRSGRDIYDAAEQRRRRDSWSERVEAYRLVDFGVLNKGILAGWGIEMRDPTADRELVEFCLTLPDEMFRLDGEDRALARRIFGSRLPEVIIKDPRRGYQAADWRRNLVDSAPALVADLKRAGSIPTVQKLIAVTDLTESLGALGSDTSLGQPDELRLRRGALRGLAAAHFIRKVEGSNV